MHALKQTTFVLALLTVLTVCASAQEQTREGAWQHARELAASNHFDEALLLIRAYADPSTDIDAQVFVAHLHAWKGAYGHAKQIYRDVLAVDAVNVDARLGLADVLAWEKNYNAALRELKSLPASAASDMEVLLRRARYHWWNGQVRAAQEDFKQVLKVDPTHGEAIATLAAIADHKEWQLDVGYFNDADGYASHDAGGNVEMTYRGLRRWTLQTGLADASRFGENDARVTGAASFTTGRTTIAIQTSWLVGESRFSARYDVTSAVTRRFGRLAVGAGYRVLAFNDSQIQIPAAIVGWQLAPSTEIEVRLTPTYTTISRAGNWRAGASTRIAWNAASWLSPFASFAAGSTSSGLLVGNHVDYFAARTYSTGARISYSRTQSVSGYYLREIRSRDIVAQGFGTGYRLSF